MSKDVKRMSLEEAELFISDQVTSAIKSCRSSRAFGTDSLSIVHLKNPVPRPTPPVKRVCYVDDIPVWATGPKIQQLESMINSYLREVSIYLKDNSLLISASKSTVTLFTPDIHQFQMHPDITLEDTQLPLERSLKILGVIMDLSLFFHKHYNYVLDRIDKRNNMLNALSGSSWGQDKKTLLLTYNALGKSIASYAAPVWSTNASDSSFRTIQTVQNATLRTATGTHKMASIDHVHQESLTLRVKDHSDAFCAVPCELSGGGPCQSWHHNSRAKTHEGDSTPDITLLFFLDLAQAGWKATIIYTHMR